MPPRPKSPWLSVPGADLPALRLFCLPYAAGGASLFRAWPAHFAHLGVDVCPIQLPGRERRLAEDPIADLRQLVPQLHAALLPYLDVPFILLGHSMGALIAFELARELRRLDQRAPRKIIVVACRAPTCPDPKPYLYEMTTPEIINELRRYGGTPEELLADPSLMEPFLPLIRADAAITEAYRYVPEPPLSCPITVFTAAADQIVRPDEITPWREQTSGAFSLRELAGDHFLAHGKDAPLTAAVLDELTAH